MSIDVVAGRGLRAVDLPDGIDEYMAANTDRSGDCWTWVGATNSNGYGRFSFRGAQVYAHRAALALAIGEIPPGMYACHDCDNPPCVNPEHLHVGTHADNMREAAERGRARNRPRYGLDHHAAKVEPREVAAAVARYLAGGFTQAEIAHEIGVAKETFGSWVRGETRPDAGVDGVTLPRGRRPGIPLKPCGTKAAYERHRRNKEKPCEACRIADVEDQRRRRNGQVTS